MNGLLLTDSSQLSSNNSISDTREHRLGRTNRRQGTYWLGTLAFDSGWEPCLQPGLKYLKGQLEQGEGGFKHYQLFFITERKHTLGAVCRLWQPFLGHWELTRSEAAEQYVWKEATRIDQPFEFGTKPFKRNDPTDWDQIRDLAITGQFSLIPSDVFVRMYLSLCRIRADYLEPVATVRTAYVFWGLTGTGKSRRAWAEAGNQAYAKDPRTKFWCGYRGSENVIIDEFRGAIDISHLLRWLDRYPVRVETKGSSYPLMATTFWITSNLHPRLWYPELDAETWHALERRLTIEEIQ